MANKEPIYQDLFRQSDIKTFYYAKISHNGSCLITCSNDRWLQYKLDHQYSIVAPVSLKNHEPTYHLIPKTGDAKHQQLMQDAETLFNIYHPMDLIIQNDQAVEVFSFAFHRPDIDAMNFYLNHLPTLKKYAIHYSQHLRSQKTIQNARRMTLKNRALANIQTPNNSVLSTPQLKRFTTRLGNQVINLSKQEIRTLQKIMQGYGNKQIADFLDISTRTVENYSQNLKTKLHCSTKNELILEVREKHPDLYQYLKD